MYQPWRFLILIVILMPILSGAAAELNLGVDERH